MKQTTKNILGATAIVLLSSGVAVFSSYKLLQHEQSSANMSFNEMFVPNPGVNLAAFSAAHAQPVDLTQAAESSIHGVVHIRSTQSSKVQEVEVRDPFYEFFGDIFGGRGGTQKRQVQTPERTGFGSGVIISKDGYIVTNNHVIDGADEISVTLNDNRQFKGRIIGTDEGTDLALIKIEGDDFPTIPVGDSDALKVGEWVLAVGNPFNLTSTVTAGIVSAKARSLGMGQMTGKESIESYIQTDAAINQGNSGGALVNARGELVGINAALFSPTGSNTGYGFAIPTSIMKKVVADLKQYGTVQRAKLGVSVLELAEEPGDTQLIERESGKKLSEVKKDARDKFGVVDGLWVREIVEGSSAASSGIKVDDVIVGLDGKEIHKFADLQEALAKHRPGDKVSVKVMRDKKAKSIEVTLKNEQGNTKVVKNADMDILGAAFRPVSDELKRQLNLGYGLEVTGVTDGKMAAAGIRKGFIILKVNGQSMKTVDDLETVMKAASKTPEQVLFITGMFPSGKRASYAVDLSQE